MLTNLACNRDYPQLEIFLLDYNSKDDMEKWAKEVLAGPIKEGRVVYYKTFDPEAFNHSHAKNIVFKLAGGSILCNINADNFIGQGFANYLNETFQKNRDIFVRPQLGHRFSPGTAGIAGLRKDDFLKIGGFDERMVVYGWEDVCIP